MGKKKFYVVWKGVTPGMYDSWTACQLQIKGYKGALYKSFDTREEAEKALITPPHFYLQAKKDTANQSLEKVKKFSTSVLFTEQTTSENFLLSYMPLLY